MAIKDMLDSVQSHFAGCAIATYEDNVGTKALCEKTQVSPAGTCELGASSSSQCFLGRT